MRASQLLLAVAVLGLGLLVANLAVRSRVVGNFIPERTLAQALAAGPGCVATFGDSRMVAGVAAEVLTSELGRLGRPECHADLALGATDIVGHYVALRRYLERAGGPPRLIVLGMSLEGTLAKASPPDGFIGNQAIVLGWSRADDVALIYPGFPWHDFDDGFRFLTNRASTGTAYGSLIWARVRGLQDRIVQRTDHAAHNRFGLVADMTALAASFRRDVSDRLSGYPDQTPLHPAFRAFIDLAAQERIPVLLVELPMTTAYAQALARATAGPRLRNELERLTRTGHGGYVRLTQRPWLSDASFEDHLHLGAAGAREFSRDLAAAIARSLDGASAR